MQMAIYPSDRDAGGIDPVDALDVAVDLEVGVDQNLAMNLQKMNGQRSSGVNEQVVEHQVA
jgi:hypothetical protein